MANERATEAVLLVCDRVVREPGTHKAHLQGIFDKIYVSALPATLDCWLYVGFYVEDPEPGPCRLQFTLERPGGGVDEMPVVEFALADGRVEGDVQLQAVPLITTGMHRLVLTVGGARVATARLQVEQMPGATLREAQAIMPVSPVPAGAGTSAATGASAPSKPPPADVN